MIKNYLIALFGVAILFDSCNQQQSQEGNPKGLEAEVKETLSKHKGTFAVAFKDLKTGETLLINERESFHAASTMKTPVLIELYKQAAEGKFSLKDSIPVKNEFKSIVDGSSFSLNPADDSEQELYKYVGKKQLLSELAYSMIIQSSNLATNLIIDLVDAKNVQQTMRDLGANDIKVLRGVEDNKAFEKGLNNTVTAYDLMVIFEKMANGQTVNAESSIEMIDILLNQHFSSVIPAKLPKDVRVAHKTGFITGVHHDSGIVFLPNGKKYVLVILSKEVENMDAAIEAMAQVSWLIHSHAAN
ncbi:MAG: serine hydrolase [Bacteroidota bacterium]